MQNLTVEAPTKHQTFKTKESSINENFLSELINIKLPPQRSFFKKIAAHPYFMHYHRLFTLALILNFSIFCFYYIKHTDWLTQSTSFNMVSQLILINFSIAIIIRQQYIINLLFWLATRTQTHWPLAVRRVLGKIYHFGGVHSGCSVAGTFWFGVLNYIVINQHSTGFSVISKTTAYLTYSLMALLTVIVIMSIPQIRQRFHNSFELVHRFGGWSALILIWAQTISSFNDQFDTSTFANSLLSSSNFWLLCILSFSIILPWLRLRKVPVKLEKNSAHAVLAHFDYGVTPFAGSSTAVSRNPLIEWHSFANVPSPKESGYRLTISRAGDWTGSFIDDLPTHVWVKGIPTAGVGNIDQLFKRVIWVATGSGIGPCLPHLLSKLVPSLLVWSTRDPYKTYGNKLLHEILSVQPDAIIWDTDKAGKPDMVKLAYQAYVLFDAEAVICISNKKLTWQVVYGMESRGIPAYGAIWDS